MHIHVGLAQGAIVFAYVLIFGTVWRLVAAHNAGNNVGQAMSFMF